MRCHFSLQDNSQLGALLDTFDGRLQAAGLILEATALESDAVELMLRQRGSERAETLTLPQLPRDAQDLGKPRLRSRLARITAGRALVATAESNFELQRFAMHDATDKRIATIDVEHHRAVRGEAAFTLLRLRPILGFEAASTRRFAGLRRTGLLDALRQDYAETLAARRGTAAAGYRAKPIVELRRGMPASAALAVLFQTYATVMWANEDGITRDLDSEFLHDYRVALRSLRSWLGDLRQVIRKPARLRFKDDFATLNRITGRLRDLDVLGQKLPLYLEKLGATAEAQGAAIAHLVASARTAARQELIAHFASRRVRTARRAWDSLCADLAQGRQLAKRGDTPLVTVVLAAVRRRLGEVVTFDWSRAHHEPRVLHELRKECKKLRYLLEGFQGLFDQATCRRAITELKTLQTAMGDTWDLHVHHELLRELASSLAPRSALARRVLPVVHGLEADLLALERAHCDEVTVAFARFCGPAVQRLYNRLLRQS